MNRLNNKFLKIYLVFLLIFFQIYSPGRKSYAQAKTSQEVFAIVDFSNDTGDPSKDYLQKGLANSLITSLGSYSNGMISIVERGQLTSLIREMGLSSSGIVDSSNAVKLGNALGATQIIVGGLVRAGSILRLNIRVINVKTSRLTLALSEDGRSEEELLLLVDKVAEKIVNRLNNSEKTAENVIKPFDENFDGLKEINNVPSPKAELKKENTTETVENDNTWMWVVGGVSVAVAVIILAIVASKSNPQPVHPIDPIATTYPVYPPISSATPYPPTGSSIPVGQTGATSDYEFNLKF